MLTQTRSRLLLAFSLVGLLAISSMADVPRARRPTGDWPQWRGPNRDGVSTETGLRSDWSSEPRLLWTASNLGAGLSAVSIQNGQIYTMGDRDNKEYVIALKVGDGSELWSTPIGEAWNGGNNSTGPHCTPAADGAYVYALSPNGDLACLESANGKIKWSLNLKKDFDGKMMSGWGYSESPLVDGKNLICTPGGKEDTLVALDKMTGKTIWKCATPSFSNKGNDGAGYSSVVVSNGAGVKQYVQLIGHGLIGVAASDGKFLWGYGKIANTTANIPTPIVSGDYVFNSTGYGAGAALLKLSREDGGVKADEVYFLKHEDLQNHHGGMVLIDGYLYGGHGHNSGAPVCVEFKTGKIAWKEKHAGKGSAAVGAADGKLFFRYEDGQVVVAEANPEHYKQLGTFKISDVSKPSWSHPVIAGGKLYLREQDRLMCYDAK